MTELYVLGAALVGAGAYIMYLHEKLRAYKLTIQVLGYTLEQVEAYLKEEQRAEKEGD